MPIYTHMYPINPIKNLIYADHKSSTATVPIDTGIIQKAKEKSQNPIDILLVLTQHRPDANWKITNAAAQKKKKRKS